MEAKLFEAARLGNLHALHDAVREDAAVLVKLHILGGVETPLHLASMFGQAEFVREYMRLSSISAHQLSQFNQDGFSPLHLASASGHSAIVEFLLEFAKQRFAVEELCMKKDRDGRTALHCAVVSGKIEVIDVLLVHCPETATEVTFHGRESVLHLAVKHHQHEALEYLIDQKLGSLVESLLNLGDREGNTILHLATAKRLIRTVEYLVKQPRLDVNAGNLYGLRALDITFACPFNSSDVYIEEAIRHAGGSRSHIRTTNVQVSTNHTPSQSSSQEKDEEKRKNNEWMKEIRSGIIVMASLIATLAFQVALTPPGGAWQDWGPNAGVGHDEHKPGKTILYDLARKKYNVLMFSNSQTFLASIATIVALLRPFRARRWILVQSVVYITVLSITVEFFLIVSMTTSVKLLEQPVSILVILVWGVFLFVSLFGFYLGTEFHLHKNFRQCNKFF
ncbi:hypothetical protein Salat_2834000 [Sesamum alatum]|uniref:PGG domain-containing protein n=1 Tax=Sesamum alatum TaxID=300844 RepID=A0AAE1XLS4_9LAMI|nr:hypothetical protein Salat_2834000 [Sesamum alatum]